MSINAEELCGFDQPCGYFEVYEQNYNGSPDPQPHCCPHCGKLRYFCAKCSLDHHQDGWTARWEFQRRKKDAPTAPSPGEAKE